MKPEYFNLIDTLTSIRKLREKMFSQINRDLKDLSGSDFIALSKICRSTDGMSMSQLSEITGMSNALVTATVDSLERKGLVERTRGKDRRSYIVKLTQGGKRKCQEIEVVRMKSIEGFFDGMSEEDARELQDALRKLNTLLKKYL
ncbi:MAG: MarR family winged helix-turn-helix transcriptional regulator [Thermoplasmata archaeon]